MNNTSTLLGKIEEQLIETSHRAANTEVKQQEQVNGAESEKQVD